MENINTWSRERLEFEYWEIQDIQTWGWITDTKIIFCIEIVKWLVIDRLDKLNMELDDALDDRDNN